MSQFRKYAERGDTFSDSEVLGWAGDNVARATREPIADVSRWLSSGRDRMAKALGAAKNALPDSPNLSAVSGALRNVPKALAPGIINSATGVAGLPSNMPRDLPTGGGDRPIPRSFGSAWDQFSQGNYQHAFGQLPTSGKVGLGVGGGLLLAWLMHRLFGQQKYGEAHVKTASLCWQQLSDWERARVYGAFLASI